MPPDNYNLIGLGSKLKICVTQQYLTLPLSCLARLYVIFHGENIGCRRHHFRCFWSIRKKKALTDGNRTLNVWIRKDPSFLTTRPQ